MFFFNFFSLCVHQRNSFPVEISESILMKFWKKNPARIVGRISINTSKRIVKGTAWAIVVKTCAQILDKKNSYRRFCKSSWRNSYNSFNKLEIFDLLTWFIDCLFFVFGYCDVFGLRSCWFKVSHLQWWDCQLNYNGVFNIQSLDV